MASIDNNKLNYWRVFILDVDPLPSRRYSPRNGSILNDPLKLPFTGTLYYYWVISIFGCILAFGWCSGSALPDWYVIYPCLPNYCSQ